MTLLRFDAVTGQRGGRVLFDRLSLELSAGDAALVTGPNGAGKSTLIRIAAGLLAPEEGAVQAASRALADARLALDPELPLARALGFWAPHDRLAEPLAAFALADLAEVPVRLLSTGQRQRAALARVAASGAPLWLLDEPVNGLDGASTGILEAMIAGHRRDGGAVVVATHIPLALPRALAVELGR